MAYPGKIIEIIDDQHALVDFNGLKKTVNISLLESAEKGDYVTVHAGFAIQVMNEEGAWEVLKLYEEIKSSDEGSDRKNP